MNQKTIKQKQHAKLARQQALNWLAKRFPEAFDNQRRIRPLKIGIMHDIMAFADEALRDGISKTKLREAVVLYTRRIDYLTCLKAREMRVDLSGQSVCPVHEEDAERASVKIKKRVEKSSKHAYASHLPTTHRPATASQVSQKQPFKTYLDYTYNQSPRLPDLPTTPRATPSITIKRKIARPMTPEVTQQLREKLDLET